VLCTTYTRQYFGGHANAPTWSHQLGLACSDQPWVLPRACTGACAAVSGCAVGVIPCHQLLTVTMVSCPAFEAQPTRTHTACHGGSYGLAVVGGLGGAPPSCPPRAIPLGVAPSTPPTAVMSFILSPIFNLKSCKLTGSVCPWSHLALCTLSNLQYP